MDAASSPPLSIQRGPDCLIVRVDGAHEDRDHSFRLVDRLLGALESHSLKSIVVETQDCSDRLLAELKSLGECVTNRGGKVKLVDNRSNQTVVDNDPESTRIPVFPDLRAAFFAHRIET